MNDPVADLLKGTENPTIAPKNAGPAMSASQTILNIMHGVGNYASDAIGALGDEVKGGVETAEAGAKQGAADISQGKPVQGVVAAGTGATAGAVKTIFAPVSALFDATGKQLQGLGQEAANSPAVQQFAQAHGAALDAIKNAQSSFDKLKAAHPELATDLSNAATTAMGVVGGKAAEGEGTVDKMAADQTARVKTAAGAMKQGAETMVDKVKGAASKVADLNKQADAKVAGDKAAATDKKVVDLVSEKPNKKLTIAAYEKAGGPGGVKEQGLMRKATIEPTAADTRRAEAAKDYVDPSKSAPRNLIGINKGIKDTAGEVEQFLKENPGDFKMSDKAPGWTPIVQKLADIEMPDLIKADSTLEKTYNLVRDRMVEQIQKAPHNNEGLWDARKKFDRVVEDQFGDAAFDSEKNTAIKRAISDMRHAVNKYIGESSGDKVFETKMQKMTDLYDARYNIAEKSYDQLHESSWAKTHPTAFKALFGSGAAITGIAADKVLKAFTGLGI